MSRLTVPGWQSPYNGIGVTLGGAGAELAANRGFPSSPESLPMTRTPMGRQSATITSLANQVRAFRDAFTGWFGPGTPLVPTAAEASPRARQMPVGVNLNYLPRAGEQTSFEQLRYFAANYDVARIAIEKRKKHLTGLKWAIRPRADLQDDDRSRLSLSRAQTQYSEEIRTANAFFARPDRVNDWPVWLSMVLEDRLVCDAATIYPRFTRGGALYALEPVDGTTVKVLVDNDGRSPTPPLPAYQQVLYGVPRGMWARDEILYLPQNARTFSPYGWSELEGVMYVMNMAMRKRLKDMAFFTESNIPAALLGMPADWSAENIRQYQEYLDEWLGGDIPRRSNLTLVPSSGGVPVHEFAPFSADPTFDTWLMKITCAALDVTPAEIGFTDDVNRSSGEGQEDVQLRSQRSLIMFVRSIVDRVLTDYLGMPFLEWHSQEGESDDDLNRAQVHQIYLGVGVLQLDEVRAEIGRKPLGVPPVIPNGGNLVPIDQIGKTPPPGADGGAPGGPPGGAPGGAPGPAGLPAPAGAPAGAPGAPAGALPASKPPAGVKGFGLGGGFGPSAGIAPSTPVASVGKPTRPAPDTHSIVRTPPPGRSSFAKATGEDVPGAFGALGTPPAWWPVESEEDHVRRAVTSEMRADLVKWRTVALKSAKDGRPYRDFQSDVLPGALRVGIERELDETMQRNVPERPGLVRLAFAKAIGITDLVAKP